MNGKRTLACALTLALLLCLCPVACGRGHIRSLGRNGGRLLVRSG